MFYFVRTVFLFLVLFVGVSLGVHWIASHYVQDHIVETGGDQTFASLLPRSHFKIRDTQTGLMLAGVAAQNKRDWGRAWQNFSALNDQFNMTPQNALRVMTLALGNGEVAEVGRIANHISDQYFETEASDLVASEAYDLVRLFLVVDALKKNDLEQAKELNKKLEKSVLSKFAAPIIDAWLKAEIDPKALSRNVKGLSDTQIVYKALAAKYASDDKLYETLSGKIRNPVFATMANENPPQNIQSAVAMAFHDLSKAMISERAVDSALLFAQMAAYLDPNLSFIYATVGDVLMRQKQDQKALDFYARVAPTEGVYKESIRKMVDILIEHERYDDALELIAEAQQNLGENDAELEYIKGNVYRADKQLKKALTAYDNAEVWANENGDLPRTLWPLYYSRAIVLDLMGRWDEAEKDLLIALEKFPNSPIILNYIGYAYADRGIKLDEAKDMISRAVMAAPNDSFIIDSMGWILFRMGDYEEAKKYLERAASIRPYHMVINDHLGDTYWKLGRTREAYYMWQRAADYYDPNDEEQARMIDATRKKLKEGLN